MKYKNLVKISMITFTLVMGLTGCEGPGPEYQTPMVAYSEQQDDSTVVYQEIYREKKQEDFHTILLFDSGKTQITPSHKKILQQQANYLKQNPQAIIRIEGHADAKGKPTLSQNMAAKRASEMAKFLRMQGISPKRIETRSFGAKSPTHLGEDAQTHAKNRRVELIILPDRNQTKS